MRYKIKQGKSATSFLVTNDRFSVTSYCGPRPLRIYRVTSTQNGRIYFRARVLPRPTCRRQRQPCVVLSQMRLGHPLSTSDHEQQDRLTKGRRVIWLSRARFHEGPRQNNSKLHQSRQEKIITTQRV